MNSTEPAIPPSSRDRTSPLRTTGKLRMALEVKLPSLGDNVADGDVIDVKVKVGDVVQQGQALIEVEAEKTSADVPAPAAGRVAQLLVKKGDKVKPHQVIAVIESSNGQAAPAEAPKAEVPKPAEAPKAAEPPKTVEPPKPVAPPTIAEDGVVHAGPATRRLAREFSVDLAQVPGTGTAGRVSQDDVKDYLRTLATGGGGAGGVKAPPVPNFEQWGPVTTKPFESIRKATAEHLSMCWNVIPHVTHNDLADVTDIEAFRKQQDAKGPAKLTVTAFVLKACAIMLKQMPQFNASLDTAQGQLVLKSYYHLGVAVDTERGLVVPKLRDVDKKSVHDLAQEMNEIAERARQKKLTREDLQGGTFTISNLGGIGGTGFSPIVNWPEVAILGLSRSRLQPVWKDNQWAPRLFLPLSLSYDHRVIDGADAARFCRRLAELLENPLVMLLHA
jgi:pyruvate dehydrogenase E2 component (dihydrolipoamide acetyltransferase)